MNENTGIVLDLDSDAWIDVSPRRYSSLRNGREEKGADITIGAVKHRIDEKAVGELIDELVASFPVKVEEALIDWGVTKAYLEDRIAKEVAA